MSETTHARWSSVALGLVGLVATLGVGLGCGLASAQTQQAGAAPEGREVAIFAGGCFWCMEGPFEAVAGVESVLSGYTGGRSVGPTYSQVSSGRSGHIEAIRVVYDPEVVSYERLLDVFFHNIDPTQADGQFCDRGPQYRSAIFVSTPGERAAAEAAKREMGRALRARIATEILSASVFWIAEDYHQGYHRTHPVEYQRYRMGCGRDARLRALYGANAVQGAMR